MATEFQFEHVFHVPSMTTLLMAYFDPGHKAKQDQLAELTDREVVESRDDEVGRAITWRVAHAKPLPLFVRPFAATGRLRFVESITWHRGANSIDLTVTPEVLGGRVTIHATYTLTPQGPGEIRRRYAGAVSANLRLIGGRVERGIIATFEREMPRMTACTQSWLDGV